MRRNAAIAVTIAALSTTYHPAVAKISFQRVNVPGAYSTRVLVINDAGVTAGTYTLATSSETHGFIRKADGAFTTFDPPGSAGTSVSAINAVGDVVGSYALGNGFATYCYIRSAAGVITTFKTSHALKPMCQATAINDNAEVAGDEFNRESVYAFLRSPSGRIRRFERTPRTDQLDFAVTGLNDSGTVTGLFREFNGQYFTGFVRARSGPPTSITFPYGPTNITEAGISGKGAIAGYASNFGFIRAADGSFTIFNFSDQNATYTYVYAINAKGDTAGDYFVSPNYYAFLRKSTGDAETLALPTGVKILIPLALNARDVVAGVYESLDGISGGGFILTTR